MGSIYGRCDGVPVRRNPHVLDLSVSVQVMVAAPALEEHFQFIAWTICAYNFSLCATNFPPRPSLGSGR